ncbi:MAG: indole-3-glycerol phosphate synthase TrpC [Pseudomonadota bacterium]
MKKDFLQLIIDRKRLEIRAAQKELPEDRIREKAEEKQREKRPFYAVLAGADVDRINIIAEIKRASPSKGDIRPDLDPFQLAGLYEKGGASALSVLTDTSFFKGSADDFQQARQGSGLPMLRKDFLISSYQIYESVLLGADAVLLIARILSREQLKDYLMLCRELNLDALVEIHNPEDLENAIWAKAALIGINNRNLSSFDTDIRIAMELVSRLEPYQTPVAASGISGREDIVRNLSYGIHNFLIGESLVKAKDPAGLIRSLTGRKE